MARDKRPTTLGKANYEAQCMACEWSRDGVNGLALAAIHHDKTGHLVEVRKTQSIFYGDVAL